MVNPGIWKGARLEFMKREQPYYARAVCEKWVAEAVLAIQRRYFKRFPVDLPLDQDPSEDHLTNVDDNGPDAEVEKPDSTKLTAAEYELVIEKMKARKKALSTLKEQIKRWFSYHHGKDSCNAKVESETPYAAISQRLVGKDLSKPRLKTPANLWRKNHRKRIEDALAMNPLPMPKDFVMTRASLARSMFAELHVVEQNIWIKAAQDEHKVALAKWNNVQDSELSMEAADRQRVIQNLIGFMQPILDGVCEATGWKATLITGGPEPAQDGQLSVISIHSGETSGDIKMNFGRAERQRYKKYVLPIYAHFLQQCYTPAECRSRALPQEDSATSMASYEFGDDSVTFDAVGRMDPVGSVPLTQPLVSTLPLQHPTPSTQQPPNVTTPTLVTVQPAATPKDSPEPEGEFQSNPFPFDFTDEALEVMPPSPKFPSPSPFPASPRPRSSPPPSPALSNRRHASPAAMSPWPSSVSPPQTQAPAQTTTLVARPTQAPPTSVPAQASTPAAPHAHAPVPSPRPPTLPSPPASNLPHALTSIHLPKEVEIAEKARIAEEVRKESLDEVLPAGLRVHKKTARAVEQEEKERARVIAAQDKGKEKAAKIAEKEKAKAEKAKAKAEKAKAKAEKEKSKAEKMKVKENVPAKSTKVANKKARTTDKGPSTVQKPTKRKAIEVDDTSALPTVPALPVETLPAKRQRKIKVRVD